MTFSRFSLILRGLGLLFRYCRWRHPAFAERLKEKTFTAQIKTADDSEGRWFRFENGRVTSGAGIRADAEVVLAFKNAKIAAELLTPPIDQQEQIDAIKDFKLTMTGPDELTSWFTRLILLTQSVGWKYGIAQADGSIRYTSMTNGGPVFVYVKDGKILRLTPIEFDDSDPQPWTIKARGKSYTPPRKTTLAPHGQNFKSIVYSPDRCLYPMKRVDFDPNGERNPQNRGVSGYERISWDEALDIVAERDQAHEARARPGRDRVVSHGSHHTWGNIGYYLSANFRFMNADRPHRGAPQPRQLGRLVLGRDASLGLQLARRPVRELRHGRGLPAELRDDRVLVGQPGSDLGRLRRVRGHGAPPVAQELGHQDRSTSIPTTTTPRSSWAANGSRPSRPPRPRWAWPWPTSGSRKTSTTRTTSPPAPRASTCGRPTSSARRTACPRPPNGPRRKPAFPPATSARSPANGAPSAPIWAPAAGAPATAARAATPPASSGRASCVCLMAMQGLGKPGINFGNLQWGTPVDFNFYFPGYAEGGMSGDMEHTAMAVQLFQRMPQLPTINTPGQKIPRMQFPEAILDGKAEGYMWDGKSIEHQFRKIVYPDAGPFAGAHALQVRRLGARRPCPTRTAGSRPTVRPTSSSW